jgi:hypothetical protein
MNDAASDVTAASGDGGLDGGDSEPGGHPLVDGVADDAV